MRSDRAVEKAVDVYPSTSTSHIDYIYKYSFYFLIHGCACTALKLILFIIIVNRFGLLGSSFYTHTCISRKVYKPTTYCLWKVGQNPPLSINATIMQFKIALIAATKGASLLADIIRDIMTTLCTETSNRAASATNLTPLSPSRLASATYIINPETDTQILTTLVSSCYYFLEEDSTGSLSSAKRVIVSMEI